MTPLTTPRKVAFLFLVAAAAPGPAIAGNYPLVIQPPYAVGMRIADDHCAEPVGNPVCEEEASADPITGDVAVLARIASDHPGTKGTARVSAGLSKTIDIPDAEADQAFEVTVHYLVKSPNTGFPAIHADAAGNPDGGDMMLWLEATAPDQPTDSQVRLFTHRTRGTMSLTATARPGLGQHLDKLKISAGVEGRIALGTLPDGPREQQVLGNVEVTRIVVTPAAANRALSLHTAEAHTTP